MQSVEFKAELRDIEAARRQCSLVGAHKLGTLKQKDTYFRLADGRLKRREAAGEPIEWIFYHRNDVVYPATSRFSVLSDEHARRRWGVHSLRPWVDVSKTRELWMMDNVRIHLDSVDELGTFLELEATITPEFDAEECNMMVCSLRDVFMPALGEPIAVSYSDLAAQQPVENP